MHKAILYSILIMCVMLTTGCKRQPKQAATEQVQTAAHDLAAIQKRGRLVVLTLYGSTTYFNYRGEAMGFQYELCEQFAQYLKVDLKVETAFSQEELIRKLQEGKGDLIAYNLLVSKEWKDSLIYCGAETLSHQVLVQRKGRKALTDVTELPGKEVYVVPGRYEQRLQNLNQELGGGIKMHVVDADSLSEEDLMEQVSQGKIDYTIGDNEVAEVNRTYFRNLDVSLNVSFMQRTSWAVRKDAPRLAEAADRWFKQDKVSKAYKASHKRYFEQNKHIEHAAVRSYKRGEISLYDELFKKYGEKIGWDWRLLAALAYAESNFNPNVVAWSGARGLMQLMPSTARRLGVPRGKETDPEESVKAAAKYIARLDKSFASVPAHEERVCLILAAYNAGEGHIKDAIALTAKHGGDPTIWSNHIEKYLKLKSNERYFNDPVCRYGYFRGEETCRFVNDIINRYRTYQAKIKD